MTLPMYTELEVTIRRALDRVEAIAPERRALLDQIASYISSKGRAGEEPRLTFICTHNSRRSQMGQLWAAAAAAHFGVDGVKTFSGGTEVTAFNPRAVAAMRRAGFAFEEAAGADANPHYLVRFSDDTPPLECFSKVYDDPFTPSEGFAALMTCGEADEACPVVYGAAARVALRYVDPKAADDTPREAAAYDERSDQIATEMLYAFSKVA